MKRRKTLVGAICATTLLFASCGGETEGNEIQNVTITDSTDTAPDEMDMIGNESNVEYSVPTPNELFEIIKLQGGDQQPGLVNPLENAENYIDQSSKSINFGVYSADVAYLSCFGIGTDFLRYFKKIEELGDELGISGAFDEDLMDRIENNEGDTDSLFSISNDTYYESYMYLEENDKGIELALIMAGGYVESLYIITNLVESYADDNPIIQKIGDQKVVLENLMDFIFEYSDDSDVANVIGDMMDLDDIFAANMTLDESASSVSNENGTLSISGGGSYQMTEEAFNAIKSKAEELRIKYTK